VPPIGYAYVLWAAALYEEGTTGSGGGCADAHRAAPRGLGSARWVMESANRGTGEEAAFLSISSWWSSSGFGGGSEQREEGGAGG